MKNAYLIPVSAFKIEDLSGSDLAVLAAIHVAWLNVVRCRRPPSRLHPIDVLRGDRDSWLRGRLRPRSAHPADGVRALALESDLSDDMAVGDQELDAITCLIGNDIDDLLAGS